MASIAEPTTALSTNSAVRRQLFVSWISHHGRSEGLSEALGARCAFIAVGRLTDRRTAPVRHAVQALRTVALLVRTRPRVLYVMAPPSLLVAIALGWRVLTGCLVVVDAHTKAVLHPTTGRPRPTWLLRRADLVVVTTRRLAAQLHRAGVRATPLHDAPLAPVASSHEEPHPPTVVMPASWYVDEPWADVVDAASRLPDITFLVTGRPPADVLAEDLPANLRLTGFLSRSEYDDLIRRATVVLALTTREDTMQRAAYEAVAAGRPVVASDTVALREHLTSGAVFARAGGAPLAEAVQTAVRAADRLRDEVAALREAHAEQFAADLAALLAAVGAAR